MCFHDCLLEFLSKVITKSVQPAFTCSNVLIETLEQGAKNVQSRSGVLLLTLNIFHTLF